MIVDINVGVPRTNLSEYEINSLTQTVSFPTSRDDGYLDTTKLQMYNAKYRAVYKKIDTLCKEVMGIYLGPSTDTPFDVLATYNIVLRLMSEVSFTISDGGKKATVTLLSPEGVTWLNKVNNIIKGIKE